jgi:hypothetical protein
MARFLEEAGPFCRPAGCCEVEMAKVAAGMREALCNRFILMSRQWQLQLSRQPGQHRSSITSMSRSGAAAAAFRANAGLSMNSHALACDSLIHSSNCLPHWLRAWRRFSAGIAGEYCATEHLFWSWLLRPVAGAGGTRNFRIFFDHP